MEVFEGASGSEAHTWIQAQASVGQVDVDGAASGGTLQTPIRSPMMSPHLNSDLKSGLRRLYGVPRLVAVRGDECRRIVLYHPS